jgi:hypothetical protein
MTWLAVALCASGCSPGEGVPPVDAGGLVDSGGPLDDGALDAGDPSVYWPPVVQSFSRKFWDIYPCDSALLWSFEATSSEANDEEVWVWEVGGTPRALAIDLLPVGYRRLAGCHEGFAYWNEHDGMNWSLYRRSMSGDGEAEFVRGGGSWSVGDGGPWSLGEAGRATRGIDRTAIELLDIEEGSTTTIAYEPATLVDAPFYPRATLDYLYVA